MIENKEQRLQKYDCLDNGFIRLVDYMGDDYAIVQAARVSYGLGTKTVTEERGLIRHLMRFRHTSPFEMVEFKFHVKLPIFVARQWIRHRTANVNEYSGRYSILKDEFYVPELELIRTQSTLNKQGRSLEMLPAEKAVQITEQMKETQKHLFDEYNSYLELDMARELARINLPLSTYTEWYWKIDLHNLFHFLKLRLDKDAQYEIRVYADKITEIIKPIVPLAYEAFEDYELNSVKFSKNEMNILKSMINQNDLASIPYENYGIRLSEAREFKEKINKIFE